jgi:ABC-type phosphate/phosphonate transport system substrate-binding protein
MVVSLPMYDLPELAAATDAWWAGLRRHLAAQGVSGLPVLRSRPGDLVAHWLNDAPVFTQTCGYPLTHVLEQRVRLLATPRYRAPGCAGASYVSWVVLRGDDPASRPADLFGRRVAFNGRDSQSGYNALRALMAPFAESGRAFAAVSESGGHRRSLAMVKSGTVDVAAIDCVSFALIARAAPEEVRGIRVLWATAAAPGLPYVTAAATSDAEVARLRAGIAAACADPELSETRALLLIDGCDIVPRADYAVISRMESAAADSGYPELR